MIPLDAGCRQRLLCGPMTTSNEGKPANRPTYVGLPGTMHEAMAAIAAARHCSLADVIREACIAYLASPEAKRGVA